MQQLRLFGSAERIFVNDETGRIAYHPALFEAAESKRLFEHFAQSLQWSQETMWMYDRSVAVPRPIARFEGALPAEVSALRERVERFLLVSFNAISFQYYRDANDSVAWHSDHTEELIDLPVVAVLSLGAVREMHVRSKRRPRRTFRCPLEPGSLFVMAGRAQDFWEHHIPKLPGSIAPRISVAFRQKRSA